MLSAGWKRAGYWPVLAGDEEGVSMLLGHANGVVSFFLCTLDEAVAVAEREMRSREWAKRELTILKGKKGAA